MVIMMEVDIWTFVNYQVYFIYIFILFERAVYIYSVEFEKITETPMHAMAVGIISTNIVIVVIIVIITFITSCIR